jgi:hypothetical protein
MKTRLLYFGVCCLGLLCFIIMISAAPSPETLIIGNWKELSWEYEKVNKSDSDTMAMKHIPEDVKNSIGQNLVIHAAETWTFLPNRKLRLETPYGNKLVEWCLKGRGNVLQLKYDNNTLENYNITFLNNGALELNFETDIQARGIAKLTFERIK